MKQTLRKNLKHILQSAANERLGKIKRNHRRKYLKVWDEEIEKLIEKKKAHKKWFTHKNLKIIE